MASYYAPIIAKLAKPLNPAAGGMTSYDPRHIEAYMRLQYSTLDHLDAATFKAEVRIACECIEFMGADDAERLALSYGL